MSAIYDSLYNRDEAQGESQDESNDVGAGRQMAGAEHERQYADEAQSLAGTPPLRRSPRPVGGLSLASRIKSLFS